MPRQVSSLWEKAGDRGTTNRVLPPHRTLGVKTMSAEPPRVLDVGQCNMDHGNISAMLAQRFGAAVERAHTIDEALAALRTAHYDLVLANRVFDADGAEGLDLIRRMQTDPQTRAVPVMMVSNYADAQETAVALGAQPGFGKAALDRPETIAALAPHLSRQPASRE